MWYLKAEKHDKVKLTNGTGAHSPASQHTSVNSVTRQSISKELPVTAVTNARSLLPHVNNLMEDIIENSIDVTIVCEVWETEVQPKLNSPRIFPTYERTAIYILWIKKE